MTVLRPTFLDDFANTEQIHPLATFTRASAAWAESYNGVWSEIPANVPRFVFDQASGESLGLLLEGARTNSIRNPRQEGAVPGTPGTLPTNYSITNNAGLTTNVIATGTTNGVQWVRYQVVGTATGAQYTTIFETTTAIVATPAQQWACSVFYRAVSGTHNGVDHSIASRTAAGASVSGLNVAFSPTSTLTRYGTVQNLDAGGTVARMTYGLRHNVTIGAYYDFQYEVGWPQAEAGYCVSTPILPAVASPAASTRAADGYSVPVSLLEVPAEFPATIVWEGVLGQGGAAQNLWQADDNSAANRYLLRREANGTTLAVFRVITSASSGAIQIGTVALAGQKVRVATALDGLGGVRGSMNGLAVAGTTGGPTSGIVTLRLGASSSGSDNLFGPVARIAFVPRNSSDAIAMLLAA